MALMGSPSFSKGLTLALSWGQNLKESFKRIKGLSVKGLMAGRISGRGGGGESCQALRIYRASKAPRPGKTAF
jgi:hypothetical protein